MFYKSVKRLFDIIMSIIGLPFFFVIFIVVAPLIKATDKGPVFYNGERIGKDGKIFRMIKFRTMIVNAPDIRLADGNTYSSSTDARVTKFGGFLRETSLDETPQVLNILLGQMSFIGPRPDTPDWLDRYTSEEKLFLRVRPGITGYSQSHFRNSVDIRERIKYDVYYAQNCSFFMDISILFHTVRMVLKRENIYTETQNEEDKA